MTFQYPLARLLQLVIIVAVICSLFASLKWPLAFLSLSGMNVTAFVVFWIGNRKNIALLAGATAFLILATLFFTDWGLSSPHPVVRVAWPYLIAACVSEFAVILCWLFRESKPDSPRSTNS